MIDDIFSINCDINFEKIDYLYNPFFTECPPNDPFNNWTLDTCEIILKIYQDFLDTIYNEFYDTEFEDSYSSENTLMDDWIIDIIKLFLDFQDGIRNDPNDIEILDSLYGEIEASITDDWIIYLVTILSDFIDADGISFEDSYEMTGNILTDSWINSNVSLSADFLDTLTNEQYDIELLESISQNVQMQIVDDWKNEFVEIFEDFIDADGIGFEDSYEVSENVLTDDWSISNVVIEADFLDSNGIEFKDIYENTGNSLIDVWISNSTFDINFYDVSQNVSLILSDTTLGNEFVYVDIE